MAGVAGMAEPSQVQPINPQPIAPQTPQLPDQQQAQPQAPVDASAQPQADQRPSLDSIFNGQAPQRPSLDQIFGGQSVAPEKSFGDKVIDDAKAIGSSALTGLSNIGKTIMSPFEGAASSVADQINAHPLTMASPFDLATTASIGALKGITHPLSQPSIEDSAKKAFPILGKVKISIPAPNPDGPIGDPNDHVFRANITPAQALDLAANLMAPEALITGISKADAIAKLVGKGLSPVAEALNKVKPAGKLIDATNPIAELTSSTNDIQQAADALGKVGEKIPLTPSMANPADKAAQDVANAVKNNKVYLQVQDSIGDKLAKNITENVPQAFANLSKDAATTDEVFSTIQGARKSSGSVIGDLKQQATKELGSTSLKAQKFEDAVNGLLDQLTSGDEGNKLYIANEKKAEEVQNYLNQVSEKLYNNPDGLSFGEWEQIYKGLTAKSKQPYSDASMVWNKLRSAMSQSQDPMMAQGLAVVNPEAAAKFVKGKADYSSIMDAYDKMGSMIDKDKVTSNFLVKSLFDSEASGVDRAQAAMQVLGIENPKMVQDLRGHAYEYFLDKARVPISPDNPAGIDFGKFAQVVQKLQGSSPASRNLLDVLTGSPRASEMMMNLAKTSEAFAQGYQKKGAVMNETLFGRMMYYAKEIKLNSPSTYMKPIVESYQRNENLAKAFNGMDVEKIVQGFPPNQRKDAINLINKVMKK